MARKRPGCRPRKAEQFCFARVRFGAARQRSCNGFTYAGRSSLEDTLRDAEPCWNVSVTGRAYVSLFTSRGHWNANGGGRAGRPHFSRGGPQRLVAGWLVGWLATRMHQVQRAADAETNPERRMLN